MRLARISTAILTMAVFSGVFAEEPGQIEYSSFFGDNSSARINAIAADGAGNVYLAGDVKLRDLPTVNSLQPRGVMFAAKIERATNRIIYATYIGGDGSDESARGIAVDSSGNAYITGWTNTTAFPTVNAFDPSLKWGIGLHIDAFILKLDANGSRIVYSSYLGGNFDDRGYAVGVDARGAAYVAGLSQSPDFPVTPGAYLSHWSGPARGFVGRIKPDGSGIEYATFIEDAVSRLAVDGAGNVAVLARDVVRLDATGALSSRYRFARDVIPSAIAIDIGGNSWVSGYASSNGVPTTPGAIQPQHSDASYYRSDDGVQALTPSGDGLAAVDRVSALSVDPSNASVVYAGSPRGVFKSADSGLSWQPANNGLEGHSVSRIVVHPTTTGTLYALAYGEQPPARLFKSVDGAASWFSINDGLGVTLGLNGIAVDPGDPSTLFVAANTGLLKSIDGGLTWTKTGGTASTQVLVDPHDSRIIYATSTVWRFCGVFCMGYTVRLERSGDGGVTFSPVLDAPVSQLVADPQAPGRIYGVAGALFRSDDFGQTWTRVSDRRWIRIASQPDRRDLLYGIDGDGKIYRSDNGGFDFEPVQDEFRVQYPQELAVSSGGVLHVAVAPGEDGFVVKFDAGGGVAFGTYLGGKSTDVVGGLATDLQGNVYATGYTRSRDFGPLASLGQRISGPSDAFVVKLTPDGQPLFVRLLGGSGSELNVIAAVDATSVVNFAGTTLSHDFPSATALRRDPALGIQFFARLRED